MSAAESTREAPVPCLTLRAGIRGQSNCILQCPQVYIVTCTTCTTREAPMPCLTLRAGIRGQSNCNARNQVYIVTCSRVMFNIERSKQLNTGVSVQLLLLNCVLQSLSVQRGVKSRLFSYFQTPARASNPKVYTVTFSK